MLRQVKQSFILVFLVISLTLTGQDLLENLHLPKEPKTAKQNTAMLFEGIGLNVLGVAGMVGTVYWWIEFYDEEEYWLPSGTFGTSLGLALLGGGMIIKSAGNMAHTRKSYRQQKKSKVSDDLLISIEPTRYGIGIVCRF
jgi:hypothetical protein